MRRSLLDITLVAVTTHWPAVLTLLCACAPSVEPIEERCEPPELPAKSCDPQCAGCWSGGHCLLDVNAASADEVEVMLVYALSSVDQEKAFCETRDAAEAIAAADGFSEFEDIKAVAAEHGVEVRAIGQCPDGEPMGGLNDVMTFDPAASGPTCCVGDGCEAEFVCDATAVDEFPTRCTAR